MKFVLTILCAAAISVVWAARDSSSLPILDMKIVELTDPGRIKIEVRQTEGRSFRLWNDSNSWGAARWRVLILRGDELTALVQQRPPAFTRNGPGYSEYLTNFSLELILTESDWATIKGSFGGFNHEDQVIVIYEVPVTQEAFKFGVWHGTIVARAKYVAACRTSEPAANSQTK